MQQLNALKLTLLFALSYTVDAATPSASARIFRPKGPQHRLNNWVEDSINSKHKRKRPHAGAGSWVSPRHVQESKTSNVTFQQRHSSGSSALKEIAIVKAVLERQNLIRELRLAITQAAPDYEWMAEIVGRIRRSTTEIVYQIDGWRGGEPFVWKGRNLMISMLSELDTFDKIEGLVSWLGFSLRRNPFVLPIAPIPRNQLDGSPVYAFSLSPEEIARIDGASELMLEEERRFARGTFRGNSVGAVIGGAGGGRGGIASSNAGGAGVLPQGRLLMPMRSPSMVITAATPGTTSATPSHLSSERNEARGERKKDASELVFTDEDPELTPRTGTLVSHIPDFGKLGPIIQHAERTEDQLDSRLISKFERVSKELEDVSAQTPLSKVHPELERVSVPYKDASGTMVLMSLPSSQSTFKTVHALCEETKQRAGELNRKYAGIFTDVEERRRAAAQVQKLVRGKQGMLVFIVYRSLLLFPPLTYLAHYLPSCLPPLSTARALVQEHRVAREEAALQIQSLHRGRKQRKQYRAVVAERHHAAGSVQSMWRAKKGREEAVRRADELVVRREEAAEQIQAAWRGKAVRRDFETKQRELDRRQAEQRAAVLLQSQARGRKARSDYAAVLSERNDAALSVQALYRGRMTRRKMRDRDRQALAALSIQTYYRYVCDVVRRDGSLMPEVSDATSILFSLSSSLCLQPENRGYKARRLRILLVEALDQAAQKIQAHWRSQRERNRFLEKRDVGVLILADKLLRNSVCFSELRV